ncbi:MAG TPA: PfkB family carbohydrate kinase [Kofleriaceae bacterium]|nr:PfkB family carbohydrate kinase [Kofleriaceae bacterium]
MRVAVLGHVEWVEFLRVPAVPHAGDIVEGVPLVAVPAGGGGVAAVQLARWARSCDLFTALGDDELGHRCEAQLRARGVNVHAAWRAEPQRRAVTLIDAQRERTIILSGHRHIAKRADALPWDAFGDIDTVYVTGGDADAVRAARAAKVVVSTARVLPLLRDAAITLDALVGSDNDPAEIYPGDLHPSPRLVVRTNGAMGGMYTLAGGAPQAYAAIQTTVVGDTYGAGDTFAAAIAFGLGEGRQPGDAIAFAAARAAEVLAFHGPYG